MSIALVRAAIITTLSTVPDVGRVHAYQRHGKDAKKFRDLYQDADGRIRGWYVRRVSTAERKAAVGVVTRVVGWEIGGFLGLDDDAESELAFDALIEGIADAFRADETLGGTVMDNSDMTVDAEEKEAGIQLLSSEPVIFAGVLCHGAKLGLITSIALRI